MERATAEDARAGDIAEALGGDEGTSWPMDGFADWQDCALIVAVQGKEGPTQKRT